MSVSATYTIIGDLKEATEFVRSHSIDEFAPSISAEEGQLIRMTIPSATGVWVNIPLTAFNSAKLFYLRMDDSMPRGFVKLRLNGGPIAGITVKKWWAIVDTDITSVEFLNESGNDAGIWLFLA